MKAKRIKYSNDTSTVIQVHFNHENTYGQFVYLVNMMIEDKQKRYAFANDEFFIFGKEPENSNNLSEHDMIYL